MAIDLQAISRSENFLDVIGETLACLDDLSLQASDAMADADAVSSPSMQVKFRSLSGVSVIHMVSN